MRRPLAATLSAVLVATSTLATFAQAAPRDHRDRDRFISRYCESHPGDRDCRDWRRNHDRWSDSRYDRWYRSHRHDFGPADAAAAIFGLAAGAIAGAAANAAHIAACEARYRSYDRDTDMYLGYDGKYHYCRL